MSVALSAESAPHSEHSERSSDAVVFAQTARRAVRSGAMWGAIFGVVVASSAISYTQIYATQAERDQLATAFGSNNAAAALFGPAPQLQTVAGFTVFKSFLTLIILGAVWGLLTSTRLLRGEEDAGRWELLLTGRTTARRATVQALGAFGAAAGALWAIAAIVIVITGQDSKVDIAVGPSVYFAVALAATPVMFLAVGALTSQLAATRRQAATLAAWVLGASYVLRMVADAGVGLHWLVWASPLGWVEELQPLTSPRPLALLPVIAFAAALAVAAVHFAATRDVGTSTLPDRTHARARVRLLSGHLGLTVRLVRPVVVGWLCALGIAGLVLGLIAQAAGGTISGSSVQTVFARLGAPGAGAQAFLGVSFLIVAVLMAFVAAGQVVAARTEEAEGRLDNLLDRPVSRSAWLGGRMGLAVVVLVVGGLVAGLATWLGATTQHADVGAATLLRAGVNVVAPALCLLGIGILALGLWPRATSAAVYAVLGWSLLVEVIGGVGAGRRWLLDSSLFHQMAAAPTVGPNWETNGVMTGIGAACALIGVIGFRSRDLQPA